MNLFKKHRQAADPTLGFGESLIILTVILCILGYLIIVRQQEPQAPLFIAFTLLAIYGRLRGFSWIPSWTGCGAGCVPGSTR